MVTARTRSLRLVDPEPDPLPDSSSVIELPEKELAPGVTLEDGVLKVERDDGSVEVDFNPDLSEEEDGIDSDHYKNLAKKIPDSELTEIATKLLDGIERDERSRSEWMQMRSLGITLLGLKIETPENASDSSSAPLEGMSRIRHPLLLEATIRFQANARSELLPAAGPVKVRNDATLPPKIPPNMPPLNNEPGGIPPPGIGDNGGPSMQEDDDLADALEKDMNHYLTVTATEYVPDTDRMLFHVGFSGDGFKKVFNCPLRRRPVSESVDAEDLIVSNAATDLHNCGRVTHKIKMRKSVLKRMQIVGAYRDVEIGLPRPPQPTPVDQKKAEIAGQKITAKQPEDEDYTIYECYCELDLSAYAPKKFKDQGLPLPYRVTIERDSRQVLSVIRNWKEDDEECCAKQFFVQFPFIRGLGFYGYGFIHLLGNTTNTLTAAWREIIDAGMFASFPGFLYAKSVGRQLTNQFRIPPGGGKAIDLGAQQDIRAAIMPLPYKEAGAGHVSFITHVEETGQRLGATAEINVGEGKQDAPVGTTLALIEQATKQMDAVHKRMHDSQAQEFMLLKDRFREDPEAFWRHNKTPTKTWVKEQFVQALDDYNLVPVADPNNPTSLHRMAKVAAVKQLQATSQQLYNAQGVETWALRQMGVNPEGLFNKTPTQPPPDPRLIAIQQKAQSAQQTALLQHQDNMQRHQLEIAKLQDSAQDRESRQKIEGMKMQLEGMKLIEAQLIHKKEIEADQIKTLHELQADQARTVQELQSKQAQNIHEMATDQAKNTQDIQAEGMSHAHNIQRDHERHAFDTQRTQEAHNQKMEHTRQMHALKLEHEKELAAIRKKAAAKPAGSK